MTDDASAFEFQGLSLKLRFVRLTTRVTLSATPGFAVSVRLPRIEFDGVTFRITTGTLREAGGQEGATVEISNRGDVWRA